VAVGICGEAVTVRAKEGGGLVMDRQEPLGLSRRLEPAHDLLSSAGIPMRCFRRVVDPLVSAMLYARGEFRLGRRIGSELVGHQHPRQTPSLEELAHEQLRGRGVAPRLHEDVQDVPVRVDGPPQPMLRAVDLNDDFIEMPFIRRR